MIGEIGTDSASTSVVVLRICLWIFLVPSGLFALYMLYVGLTFGFVLWSPENLQPTLLWLRVLAAPALVASALTQRQTSTARLVMSLIAACLLDAAWIVPVISR